MCSTAASAMSGSRPARNAVKRKLLRQISQFYHAGDRLPSVRDLSRLLEVAPNTAHEAVRELATEGLVEVRPRQGVYVVAPRPDAQAATAASVAGVNVAVYFQLRDRFVIDMYEGFEAEARRHGLILVPHVNPDDDIAVDDDVQAGVLLNGLRRGTVSCGEDQCLLHIHTGEDLPRMNSMRFDLVSVDQVLGGQLAGRAMREAGCQNVTFVGVASGPAHDRGAVLRETCARRLEGFEAAFGAAIPMSRRIYLDRYDVEYGAAAAAEFAACRARSDGVFCASDDLAIGFVAHAAALGLRAGVDYQIVGFDGQRRAEQLAGMSIATVEVPAREMGHRGAQFLVDRLRHRDHPTRRLLLGCRFRPGPTLQHHQPTVSPTTSPVQEYSHVT